MLLIFLCYSVSNSNYYYYCLSLNEVKLSAPYLLYACSVSGLIHRKKLKPIFTCNHLVCVVQFSFKVNQYNFTFDILETFNFLLDSMTSSKTLPETLKEICTHSSFTTCCYFFDTQKSCICTYFYLLLIVKAIFLICYILNIFIFYDNILKCDSITSLTQSLYS